MFKIFMIQGKKLSIYLMIILKLDLAPFIKQNKVIQIKKPAEQDLKHNSQKIAPKITNSSGTSKSR